MPRSRQVDKPQRCSEGDLVERLFQSVGGELTSDEIAIVRSEFDSGPPIDLSRRFIALSAPYRSALYDQLKAAHPELIKGIENPQLLNKASSIMRKFLQQDLDRRNIKVNEDVFNMLLLDFMGSSEFYELRAKWKK